MTTAIRRLEAIVIGHVQGVGYRAFAVRSARYLNLVGYARNLPDGNVEVVAEGSENLLFELIGELRRGPYNASVEHVRFNIKDSTGEFHIFGIKH